MELLQNRVVRFGVFEADLDARELRKHGLRVKLQDQPFRVLAMLLERPGEIVTREELQNAICPPGTFIEIEHALNGAVQRIRAALGDDATNPRFIETIPRRGAIDSSPLSTSPPVCRLTKARAGIAFASRTSSRQDLSLPSLALL